VRTDEEFKLAVRDTEDIALDFVESKLHQRIRDGSDAATIFYLKTKGKRRGYIERQEFEHLTPDAIRVIYEG